MLNSLWLIYIFFILQHSGLSESGLSAARSCPPARTHGTLCRFIMGPPDFAVACGQMLHCFIDSNAWKPTRFGQRPRTDRNLRPLPLRPFPATARCFSNGCCVVHLMSRWPVVFCLRVFIFAYSQRTLRILCTRQRLCCTFLYAAL